jgi:hypothetical protein
MSDVSIGRLVAITGIKVATIRFCEQNRLVARLRNAGFSKPLPTKRPWRKGGIEPSGDALSPAP